MTDCSGVGSQRQPRRGICWSTESASCGKACRNSSTYSGIPRRRVSTLSTAYSRLKASPRNSTRMMIGRKACASRPRSLPSQSMNPLADGWPDSSPLRPVLKMVIVCRASAMTVSPVTLEKPSTRSGPRPTPVVPAPSWRPSAMPNLGIWQVPQAVSFSPEKMGSKNSRRPSSCRSGLNGLFCG